MFLAAAPPVIVGATARPCVLWPPNHKWVDVTVDVDVESECDASLAYTIVDVTSNEHVNGHGDGNSEPDWLIGEGGALKLRAERSGTGSGRIYTVHFVVEDDSGNTADGSVDVRVPHDQGKKK